MRKIIVWTLTSLLVGAVARPCAGQTISPSPRPSSFLRSLEAGFVALQAADLATTFHATTSGAGTEGNPLVANRGTAIAAKSAVSVLTVYAMEKWSRKHPRASIWVLAALDGTYAAIVAHNYRVGAR